MNGRHIVMVLAAASICLCAGCGGGDGGAGTNRNMGSLEVRIAWTGPDHAVVPQLIPVMSNSIKVEVWRQTTALAERVVTINRPETHVTIAELPAGPVLVRATAFPEANAGGVAQAIGETTVTIVAGQVTPCDLTMASTIHHLDLTPSSASLVEGETLHVIASAKDASGATVLVAPTGAFRWSEEPPTPALSVDANSGVVTADAPGQGIIRCVETESGVEAFLTVTVAGRPQCRLRGLGFSPFLDRNPDWGQALDPARTERLLRRIAPYTEWIFLFGTGLGLDAVPPLAKSLGLKVACGCWLSRDTAANAVEIARLTQLIADGYVDLAVVGTETLYRGDLTELELIPLIRQVKATGVRTTTADTWAELLAHPAVVAECDVVMANFYPYWEGIPLERAVRSLDVNYRLLQRTYAGKEVIVGETGWPSDGNAVGQAIPSTQNAASFFLNVASWAKSKGVQYFYFEAFDEEWKVAREGPQGAHWGVWDASGLLKPGYERVFNCETLPDNWSEVPPPAIEVTYLPPYGSFDDLQGLAEGVFPPDYRIVVYVYVSGWWGPKPTWDNPYTIIRSDGFWQCDITTGGHDEEATQIAIFLVPATYVPPALAGSDVLPWDLGAEAVAQVFVFR